MGQAKRAWIYCRIDAPEDLHGALKRQRQQLMDYAEQMGCEVVGSSQDTGASKQSGWPGLMLAEQAAKERQIDALILDAPPPCFGEAASMALPLVQSLERLGAAIYSPLRGKIRIGGSR